MGLIGHWRSSVLGAGGVALLLPLGLVLGVALTTALGGETTLRALGQVFAGPAAPSRQDGAGLEAADSVPSVPVRKRTSAPASSAPGGSPVPSAPVDGGDSGTPGGPSAPSGPSEPSEPFEPGQPPSAQPDPDPGSDPGPAPGSALNDVAQGAADAVSGVPIAGEVSDDAMQTVVDLIP